MPSFLFFTLVDTKHEISYHCSYRILCVFSAFIVLVKVFTHKRQFENSVFSHRLTQFFFVYVRPQKSNFISLRYHCSILKIYWFGRSYKNFIIIPWKINVDVLLTRKLPFLRLCQLYRINLKYEIRKQWHETMPRNNGTKQWHEKMIRNNGMKQWLEAMEMRKWYEQNNGKNDMKAQYGYLNVDVLLTLKL